LKIGIVIVTFNNAEMLYSVIKALLVQTRRHDEIIIIDNGSMDNTHDMVKEFQDIRYVHLGENTGSAGGFHEGIRLAIENNDFVMTLDDDIVLESNTLEIMEKYLVKLSGENRLGAIRCWFVGQNTINDVRRIKDFAWRGTFINREAVIDIGLPKKEYFLYAEDVEYSYRLSKKGWDMFIVPEYFMVDKRKKEKLNMTVFGRDRSLYKDKFRYYYAIRNQIDMYLRYKMWSNLLESLIYGAKIIVLLGLTQRVKSFGFIKAIIDGVWDGLRARLGKNPKYLPDLNTGIETEAVKVIRTGWWLK